MSDTRQLLTRIAALRDRLADAARLAPDADPAGVSARVMADPGSVGPALALLAPPTVSVEPAPAGPPLTARARRTLEAARELVAGERELAGDPLLSALLAGPGDPLALYYRDTVALTEAGLRLAQALPEKVEPQLRACDGLDAIVSAGRGRVTVLARALAGRKRDAGRVGGLARRLADLAAGRVVDLEWFVSLADDLLDEARSAAPVSFLSAGARDTHGDDGPATPAPARAVAAHALTVAQVVARVVPHDYEWAAHPATPVLAALLMDVGMLAVPPDVLGKPGRLTADERRLLAAHPKRGADLIAGLYPGSDAVVAAIAAHHERPDGTGYPAGQTGDDIPALGRMLAACDHYAALCSERPHRPAADPRTALTDTLLAAEAGRLDREFAETLLHLSMFPVGTVVELTDGRTAVVVANHPARVNLRAAARPVVAVLTDVVGEVLPRPDHVDLAAADRGGVARALARGERTRLLARHYPELCG